MPSLFEHTIPWRPAAVATTRAATPFAALLGLSVSEAGPARVVGALTVRKNLCSRDGALQDGAAMALADALSAAGAALATPDGDAVAIESSVRFSAQARRGDRLRAEALRLHGGDDLSVWETRVTRDDGALVACVTQTHLVRRPKSGAA